MQTDAAIDARFLLSDESAHDVYEIVQQMSGKTRANLTGKVQSKSTNPKAGCPIFARSLRERLP